MNERLVLGAALSALVASAPLAACNKSPSELAPAPAASASESLRADAAPDVGAGALDAGDAGADAGDSGPTDGGRDGSTKPAAKVTANAAKKLVGSWTPSISPESAMRTRQEILDKNPNMAEKQLDWELKLKRKRLENSTYQFTGKELKTTVGAAPTQSEAYTVDREDGALVSLKFKSNGRIQVFKFADENTMTSQMAPDGEVTFTRK